MVATPLPKYNPGHGDAKGKNNRLFHLPIGGLQGVKALECHIGRRAFLPRERLKDWKPEQTWTKAKDSDAFKGWLANYYMRIALPGVLVDRLRGPGGISEIVEAAFAADLFGKEAQEKVSAVYILNEIEEDLPPNRAYEISLVVVCDDEEAMEFLGRQLAKLTGLEGTPLFFHKVAVKSLRIDTADNVTLAEIGGFSRFNEWDELSSLNTRLLNMRSAV